MHRVITACLFLVLTWGLGGSLAAQEEKTPRPEPAPSPQERPDGETSRGEGSGEQPPEAGKLVEKLGSPEYTVRKQATEALRKLGEAARPALEKGARSSNLERRARCRALLNELRGDGPRVQGEGGRLRPLEPHGARRFDEEELEHLKERMRRLRERHQRALESFQRGTPFPFDELLRELLPGPDSARPLKPVPDRSLDRQQAGLGGTRVRLRQPDGEVLELFRDPSGKVTFKVSRPDPDTGETVTETYEAESLEAFREEHPQVHERYADTGLFSSRPGGFHIRVHPPGTGGLERLFPLPFSREMRRGAPVLGVEVAPVPEVLRAHLDLPEKALLVERVAPGSAAADMGLRRYDLLLRVDGTSVATSREVARILARQDHPPTLEVEVLRRGGRQTLSGPWPER